MQHVVVFECFVPGFEDVNPFQGADVQQKLPERLVVWPVAERAGNDRNNLPLILHQQDGQGDECGVEVDCLDSHLSEQRPMRRIAAELLVWGIQDRMGVPLLPGESDPQNRRFDKVGGQHPVLDIELLEVRFKVL